jgi:hypothetical protein
MLLETVFTAVAVVVLVQLGLSKVALVVVGLSLLLFVPWLVMEPIMVRRTGHAWGDLSGMWFLAKMPTLLLVPALLAIRILLIWYATS